MRFKPLRILGGGLLLLALLTLGAGKMAAQSGGQVLYNGITLPQQWPPIAVPNQNYQLPSYLTNPPAVIPIDVGRQLFVDDFLIQQTTMTRTQHQPVKYSLNPILAPNSSDIAGLAMPSSSGVWYDPADHFFKMWFFCGDGTTMCYAYSTDGKNWTRPSFANAIVPNTDQVLEAPSNTVWMDLNDPNPAQKFKMFSYQFGFAYGILTYFSPDGINWAQQYQVNYPIDTLGDRTTLFWNPFRNVWVDSEKTYTTLPATPTRPQYDSRARYYAESPDLFSWKPADFKDSFWTGPDVNDPPYPGGQTYPQLYNLDAVGYESVMVGLFSWFYPGIGDGDDPNNLPGPDLVELGVGFSRDGFQWSRPTRGGGPSNAFIPASNIAGTWDKGNTQSAGGGFLVVGDELWFYFSGRSGFHADPTAVGATGLATLRRDGFYSMNAGPTPATLTTRPVQFSGQYMFVNVKDPQGSFQIQVLDAATQATLATSAPLSVDKTLQAVTWMNGLPDLSQFEGRSVQFQFTLTNGELYSFWVTPSPDGASNGYVAANGPGFTSPKDTLGSKAYPTTAATPQFFPPGGPFQQSISVAMTAGTLGATIHYTTDGSVPTVSSSVYTGPLQLTSSAVVQAIASAPGMTSSAISSATFSADAVPPVVSVIAPLDGHIVSGTIGFSAVASDNTGVASVQFLVDGTPIGTVTSSPYTFSFSSTGLTNGTHQITAVATDVVGNPSASPPITVTVDNVTSGPTAGLIGYWSFDSSYVSGTTIFDQSGSNANATGNSTTTVLGEIGQALQFDGSTSNAVVVPGSQYDLMGNRTFALWVRTANTTQYEGLLSKFSAADAGYGYLLRTTPAGYLQFVIASANMVSGFTSISTDVTRVNDGAWHHVAVVIDLSNSVTFFVDGVQTSTFPIAGLPLASPTYFTMGMNPWLEYGQHFTGSMDEVRIYNRILSPADVAALAHPFAPLVAITAPASNQTVSTTIGVTATASDSAGIASVVFQVDGAAIGTVTSTPYALSLDTTTFANHTTHQITAVATDNEGNQGTSPAVTVTVVNLAKPTITWPTPAAITYGTPLSSTQLDATASVPSSFNYTPPAGSVLSAGAQTLSVAVTPNDTTSYMMATASVSLTVNQATPTITWASPAAIAYGTPLGSVQLNATASVPGSFLYTPSAGTQLSVGNRILSVTFTPTDTTNYKVATGSVSLTVSQATPTITWASPAAIAYGTPLGGAQLDATASVPGSFVYTPSAGTQLSVGNQTLSVTFTPTDTTNYKVATGSVSLTVSQATPTITWASPAAITYGTPLGGAQLDATASVPGSFVYTPSAGTQLSAGNQTLSVTFTPTDTTNYKVATGTVSLTVSQAAPTISWSTPAAIAYGITLSSTQLNATASVPGTFVYAPPVGTILNVGNQTLSATFTPTDTVNYKTTSASVVLTVNQIVLPSQAVFVNSDTRTQGSWPGKYGVDGYAIADANQSLPSYAIFAPQNALLWTWASSATDARALRLPNSSLGIASTWFNRPSFSYDVNLTDGNTHQIALYALDWDSPGGARAETIQIVDANSPSHVLDTESLPVFTGGTYLVWNISGHVTITITWTGGANAVISGVFFDTPSQTAPAIISASNTTFAVGSAGTFSVAATGSPTPTLSETGALPSGVTFNTKTGVLSGTPAAGTSGSYPVMFTASNGVTPNATQNFTLTVNQTQAPLITSPSSTTFTVGTAGTFSVTATGTPAPTLSETGALPSGVTFNTSTGALSGTPATGTSGSYPLTLTASNGVSSNAMQSFTLAVNPASSGGGSGVTFVGFDTATQGNWPGKYGADGYSIADSAQSLPSYASFTPQNALMWTWASTATDVRALKIPNSTLGIASTWYNRPSFSYDVNITDGNTHQIALYVLDWDSPGGARLETIQIVDANNSNNVLDSESVTNSQNGVYLVWKISRHVTISVTWTGGANAVMSGVFFDTTSQTAPAITSANGAAFAVGTAGTFSVTATGAPAPTLSEAGALPSGVTFSTATGVLSGTPATGTNGSYPVTFTASNGVSPNATQSFTLTVNQGQAPTITSSSSTTFTVGSAGTFSVTATGAPVPTLSETGALPSGVTFNTSTGALNGTPATGTNGSYPVTFTASNGVNPNATQSFTLTVNQASAGPGVTFVGFDTATQGNWPGKYGADGYSIANSAQSLPSYAASFTPQNALTWTWSSTATDVRALKIPNSTLGIASTWYNRPSFSYDVNITDGNTHQIALYALDWDSPGGARSETVQIADANNPSHVLDTEALPSYAGGTYLVWNISGHVTINVTWTGGANATVSGVFFGTPSQAGPAITSAGSTTFTVGTAGTFSVTATGAPAPTLSETGALPSGVTFNTSTGALSGTPAAGTNGSYPVTFTASNGVSPNATQSFTLTVNPAAAGGSGVTFVGFDTATQGNWQGKYGADGYSIANYAQSLPSYASFTPQNALLWTWASSATDVRALRLPNNSLGIASTWYDIPGFSYDVNVTDGNTHQIALYALDWDGLGSRAQKIQIVDANNPSNVLDSESLTNYQNGVYLVWKISGHVKINVIWTAGANAVLSGVFFK